MSRYIVRGQKVDTDKVRRADELRCQMTAEERTLWRHLRANRLHGLHFRRQQIIDGFIVDFYCHTAGLAPAYAGVEVDGPVHDQQTEYDAERDRILAARDLCTLRVRNEEITQNLSGVLMRILTAAQQKGG